RPGFILARRFGVPLPVLVPGGIAVLFGPLDLVRLGWPGLLMLVHGGSPIWSRNAVRPRRVHHIRAYPMPISPAPARPARQPGPSGATARGQCAHRRLAARPPRP